MEWRVLEKVFPDAIILFCTFHTLKWLRDVIATALVVNDKKFNLNQAFRKLVYTKNWEDFDHKLEVWKEETEGVEVRLGAEEKARRERLSEYYVKNWD